MSLLSIFAVAVILSCIGVAVGVLFTGRLEKKSKEKILKRAAERKEESRRRIAEYNSRTWKDTPLRDRVQQNMRSSSKKSSSSSDDGYYVHSHRTDHGSKDDSSSSSSDYSGGGGDSGGGGSSGDW